MGTYLSARRSLVLVGVLTAVTAAAPSPASAAQWRCEASALTGSLLNGQVQLPSVRANAGAVGCVAQTAGNAVKLPAPLDSAVVTASTSISGGADNVAAQKVFAVGGLADLKVKALPNLPIALPEIPIPAELKALKVEVPAVKDPILGLELLPAQTLSLDISQQLEALKPNRLLPNVDLLRVQGAVAYASAGCVSGAPKLAGSSQVAGISVLGTELPVGQIVDQTLTLLDSGNIDPSSIDTSKIPLPAGLPVDLAPVKAAVDTALKNALDALPSIAIPAALAQVKVTPGEQTTVNGLLTQRALRVQVGVLGQSILDATVGEATVGAGDVNCAPPVECTKKDLVLVDVYPKGNRVKLLGAAHPKYAGQMVSIVFEATGKVVAKAKVGPDGSFDTDTALPSRKLRFGNKARYMAVLGTEKSMNLKLERRMIVDEMKTENGKVVIAGRVVGPMARGTDRDITVKRRVSCTKMETVGSFRPKSDGTFVYTFDAPTDARTAVYRLSTKVRFSDSSAKLFDTYTLPRAVNLLGL